MSSSRRGSPLWGPAGGARHAAAARCCITGHGDAAGAQARPARQRRLVAAFVVLLLMRLPSTAHADLGVYSDSTDQHLTIRIAPLAPDSGLPRALYRQVQLRCTIDTEPAIDVGACGWRFNRERHFVENNSKYTLYKRPARGTVHTVTLLLTINGVTQRELGYYTCEGRNSAGLQQRAALLLDLIDEGTVQIREATLNDPVLTTETVDDVIYSPSVHSVITDVTTQRHTSTIGAPSTPSSATRRGTPLAGSSYTKCIIVGACTLLFRYLIVERL